MITVFVIISSTFNLSKCDLSLDGAKCGQKNCKRNEYCADFHPICQPCDGICDKISNNYEPSACMKKCQGN